jgi:hypothetical protein
MSTDRNCQRTVLSLPWLLNGSLEAEERREVREHLIGCPQCRAELQLTRETLAVFEAARQAANTAAEAAPVVALASWRRAAAVVRRHAPWAAAAAVVVAMVGATWTANRVASSAGSEAAPTARKAPPSLPALLAGQAPTAEPEVISSTSFENGSLTGPGIESIRPEAKRSERTRLSARLPRPAPPRALVSSSSRISTISFENGELDELR